LFSNTTLLPLKSPLTVACTLYSLSPQLTVTPVTFALATVPVPLLTEQFWPTGCEDTVTA
jgi:hypothetical protein